MSRASRVWTLEALLAKTVEEGDCLIWQGKFQAGWPGVYAQARPLRPGDSERDVRRTVNVRWLMALLGGDPRAVAEFEGRLERGVWSCACDVPGCVSPGHLRRRSLAAHMAAQRAVVFGSPVVNALRSEHIARTRRALHGKLPAEAIAGVLAFDVQADAARHFGVSRHVVGHVVARERRRGLVLGGVFSGLGGRTS